MSGEWFSRLQNRKLLVKTKRRGLHKGMRQSRTIGSSFEFSDYRPYELGDDVRQIDWNIMARTDKLYIKRFLDEQEITAAIYLDSTSSMRADITKWQLAKNLAASFSFITLANDDRLVFVPVGLGKEQPPTRRKGSLYSKQIYYEISQLDSTRKTGQFCELLANRLVKKVQIAIIITDGLEPVENYETLFRRLAPICKQVRFLQLLSKEEIHPDYTNDMKLLDSENDTAVNVTMSEPLIRMYKERLKKHNEQLQTLVKRFGFSYLLVTDEMELSSIIFDYCLKSGWLE